MAKKLLYTLMCFFVLFFLLACGSTKHNKREIAAEQEMAAEREMATERAAALKAIEAEKEAARTVESRIAAMREEENRLAEKEKRIVEEMVDSLLAQTPVTPAASEFKYDIASDGGVKITKYLGSDISIKVPEKIEGLPVTEIARDAFNKNLLLSIVLPGTIKKMSFQEFEQLREVTLGDGMKIPDASYQYRNGVKMLSPDDGGLFAGCIKLKKVTIGKGITVIPGGCFLACENLQSIELPVGLKEIGIQAFSASGLTSIVIPDSVTSIGMGAFASCENLTSVKLPAELKKIEYITFSESGLKSIVIPNSVTDIDVTAFYQCKSLTSVTLPTNLKNVYGWAFAECDSLTEINVPENLQKVIFHHSGTLGSGRYSDRHIFAGSSNIPLATKSKLRAIGYGGSF